MSTKCPLCLSLEIEMLPDSPAQMDFWGCNHCGLLFKGPTHHLLPQEERQRYLLHENSAESAGYVNFLAPVVQILEELRVPKGALGLDFGCGPSPVLAQMLAEKGYLMQVYDPYFFPELSTDLGELDFLVCTEAAEHFYEPRREVERMRSLLTPNAPVVWMTSVWRGEQKFSEWYYIKDPSHVTIYTEKTLRWIGELWGKTPRFRGKNLIWWT